MSELKHEHKAQTAEKVFQRYLRDRGLKYTQERKTLLREILRGSGHFDAEQLLVTLRQGDRRVAKATIYRTLPLLVDCGLIKQVQFGEKLARYEHTFGREPHDHMVCHRCQRVIEFDNADVARLRGEIAVRHGFHATGHRFQITGLCAACLRACPAADGPQRTDG